eukprot:jgi/Undpi1/7392/HiC_scaffold_22.g09865.m1
MTCRPRSKVPTESNTWGLVQQLEAMRAAVTMGVRMGYLRSHVSSSPWRRRPTWFEAAGKSTVAQIGQKEIGVKTGGKEETRITAVLTVLVDGSKLPPLHIFKGQLSSSKKFLPANSIERGFTNYEDKKGYAYPRGVVYAVDPKAWHSQRVFDNVWMPHVWRKRPGQLGRGHGYR